MRPSEALRLNLESVRRLAARIGATNIRVFGSVIRGEDTETSDLDILIDVPRGTTIPDLVGLEHDLSDKLGVDVDVLTPGDLHPYFREHVLQEARPL
jgi:predicted nucleotidyltransferase